MHEEQEAVNWLFACLERFPLCGDPGYAIDTRTEGVALLPTRHLYERCGRRYLGR